MAEGFLRVAVGLVGNFLLLRKHDVTPHHHSSQVASGRLFCHHAPHHAPAPQDGDAMGYRHHFLQLVRDEDDGALLSGHQP